MRFYPCKNTDKGWKFRNPIKLIFGTTKDLVKKQSSVFNQSMAEMSINSVLLTYARNYLLALSWVICAVDFFVSVPGFRMLDPLFSVFTGIDAEPE